MKQMTDGFYGKVLPLQPQIQDQPLYDMCNVSLYNPWRMRLVNSISPEQLTHWGRDKIAAISHPTFWKAFSWMKMYEFHVIFQ